MKINPELYTESVNFERFKKKPRRDMDFNSQVQGLPKNKKNRYGRTKR